MKTIPRIFPVSLLLLSLFVATGCTTLSVNDDINRQIASDPLENINRSIYSFNRTADKYILRPVAKAYDNTLPQPAKKGVSNFFSNLGEPLNVLNNLLQGKTDRALSSTFRFAVNSTVGLLGLLDVASKYDVKKTPEDFGQTLAGWGVAPGPYLMVPIFGPTNLRDGFGGLVDTAIYHPINDISDSGTVRTGLIILDAVSNRAELLGTDKLLESQIDEYSFIKIAVEQNRIKALYDGTPPEQEIEDFDDF